MILELFTFSFLGITGWGMDLDYRGSEWFALESNRDCSVIFEIVPKYCMSGSLVGHEGDSISSKRFSSTVIVLQNQAQNTPQRALRRAEHSLSSSSKSRGLGFQQGPR